jgi:hypothetical protein
MHRRYGRNPDQLPAPMILTGTMSLSWSIPPADDITVTLADVDTFDNPVTIKKIAAGNTVTIATTDSQNIDSDSTKTLTLLGSAITVYPDTTADLWRVQNPVVSELTATATEINTACDGITATASEINTACDGITKTAAD